ncbi:ATP-grasp domain-containing protein [Croceimicrobium hydrocarbonivorans]|uniref:ATP-grasp domain-containing protein n=1 Tax=Croceimicrobium hydrocarbonivorans TaxID=2761580 RepID=A0A7H0VAH1_9FLAO|nr:ATP-grasp domain-containing protein [Croceimicrobium hydrocarbonivorans]QNR22719.1 ATP-grasp domain-containing protein [Croceimicrobium hydrocarbonivorans]
MKIIFCNSFLDPKQVDPDFEAEWSAAQEAGFECLLISFEDLQEGNLLKALKRIMPASNEAIALYRGWMLKPFEYQDLYEGLLDKNIRLLNSPQQYKHCHYLPESYKHIQDHSPESYWTSDLDMESIRETVKPFGSKSIILKDFVKSEKHHWLEACFIPDASDFEKLQEVVSNFLELRGHSLNEGLVFREFIDLEALAKHSKSGMPLSREYRIFFLKNEAIQSYNYWEEGDYEDRLVNLDFAQELAQSIESNFFSMDIAKSQAGQWIIMELGDGQVSGLPDDADPAAFYKTLIKKLDN